MVKKVMLILIMAMVVMPPLSHGGGGFWAWGDTFLSKNVRIRVYWDQPPANVSDPIISYNVFKSSSKIGTVSGLTYQWIGQVNVSKYRALPTSLSVQAVDKDGISPLSTIKVYYNIRTNKLITIE